MQNVSSGYIPFAEQPVSPKGSSATGGLEKYPYSYPYPNKQIQNISSGLFPEAQVILEGSAEYDFRTYQYAKTSIDQMKPQAIIYPTGIHDILTVVNYAKKNGLGIAVRTGGHQYSGKIKSLDIIDICICV